MKYDSVPSVFWITGLSGAGKSTIGNKVVDILRSHGDPVVLLDGDALREIFGNICHSKEARLAASLQYSRLCKMLVDQQVHVVCCTISLFHQTQEWNRKHIDNYIEVLVDVSLDELKRRDSKLIYSRAESGQIKDVVGIDITPEWPINPDIIINNTDIESIDKNVDLIFDKYTSVVRQLAKCT